VAALGAPGLDSGLHQGAPIPRLLLLVALLAASSAFAAPREISGFNQSEWTGAIVAVDQVNKTVSVKGPDGDVEVVDAKEGTKPAGTILTERTRVSTIAALADDHVVLQRKDGEKHTFPVKDPEHLKGLAVGDTVVVVETSQTAIAVDAPAAK
jgi:hypothetical protein